MSNALPEMAAQTQARRAAAANLGAWKEKLLALAEELPPGSCTMSIKDILAHLLNKDESRAAQTLEQLKRETSGASDRSEAEAIKWKEQGNKAYGAGKFEEGVLMYTRGMMYAVEDETLAVLFNNRSTAFWTHGRYVEALVDAHGAASLKVDYWKALQRRGACLEKLGFPVDGQKDMDAGNREDATKANDRERLQKIIATLVIVEKREPVGTVAPTTANATFSTSDINLVLDGKGMVTERRLDPSEIFTEYPVAHVVDDDRWGACCSYCVRATRNLIPGTKYRTEKKITRGLFCSEACANASWESYGKYEVGNTFFQLCPLDTLLANRLMRCEKAERRHLRGDFSGELYPTVVIGGYETISCVVALYFGAVSPDDADQLRLAQRQSLLHAFELKFFSGSQITLLPATGQAFIDESRPVVVGKAVYLTAARFQHSCDPNCFASLVGNPLGCSKKLTIRTIRPVLLGEQLTIAYYNMTAVKAVSAQTRRRALAERCGFMCNCTACLENKDERINEEKKAYYLQAGDLYQKGCRLIREGQYDVAVTVLTQSYNMVMEHLCPPPRPPQPMIPKTHMAFAKAFNRLGNHEKCVENLREKVKIESELYGKNHMELIDDYIRLAFFELTEEKRRVSAEEAVELLRRFYAPSRELDAQTSQVQSFVVRK